MAKILKFSKQPGKTREWSSIEARYLYRLRQEGRWSVLLPFATASRDGSAAPNLTERREELVQRDTQG